MGDPEKRYRSNERSYLKGGKEHHQGVKFNTSRLAGELNTKPRDFTKIKDTIERIRKGVNKEDSCLDTDIFLYPLFASTIDTISLAILSSIIEIGYIRKIEFLKTITEKNIEEKLKDKRDLWITYFCTTLRMEHLFPDKDSAKIQKLREELDIQEKRFIDILRGASTKVHKSYRDLWSQEGLHAETIFVNQSIAFERPEINIPFLDELLCYHDSIFFDDFMKSIITAETRMSFALWITARSNLLADTTTETYKLFYHIFRHIFRLSENGLFEEDGTISATIPESFHNSLGIVETTRKQFLEQREKENKRQADESDRKRRIQNILTQAPHVTYVSDYIVELRNIPPVIESVEITIQRNGKTYARTSISPPFQGNIDLKTCKFQTWNPDKSGQQWSTIAQWRGGDNYKITVVGRIGKEKTPENEIHSWAQEKTKKEHPKYPVVKQTSLWISAIIDKNSSTPQNTTPAPPVPTIKTTESTKSPQEQEKEDLQTALEFFLEKPSKELQDLFIDHHTWDEQTQVLTLSVPIEELEDIGYTPQELLVTEYGPLLQWESTKKGHQWITSEDTPQKIRNIFGVIFDLLAQRIERGEIDNQLSVIGFPPSDTDDNSALKSSIDINNNIDITRLLKKIGEVQEEFKKHEIPFNFYHGLLGRDGIPNSISLFSKGNWLGILTLKPAISIEVKPVKGKTLPQNTPLLTQRIENALLNFIYQYLKNGKGISSIIRRTYVQENTKKLRESYRRDLKKKTARLLIENPDGVTFTIVEGISTEGLKSAIQEAQTQYGVEKVGLLYRKSTYAFPGDTSISKPSPQRSEEDYTSLNIPERRIILKERILKTLFNGNSKVKDRSAFVHGSAVFQALQFDVAAFKEKNSRDIAPGDISDDFLTEFIDILQSRYVLISYRDYCAGGLADLTELDEEQQSPE